MNVVLCSGVMRSGSTWCYNVLRGMVGATADLLGLPFYCSYLEGKQLDTFLTSDESLLPGAAVFKTHALGTQAELLIERGIVKNICSVRDPRDCVASRLLFKSEESLSDSIRLVRGSFASAVGLEKGATLFLDYKDIVHNPKLPIGQMMDHLGLNFKGRDEIMEFLINEFSMENMENKTDKEVDPLTELHKNHVHGGTLNRWKDELTEEQVKVVEKKLAKEIKWYQDLFKC